MRILTKQIIWQRERMRGRIGTSLSLDHQANVRRAGAFLRAGPLPVGQGAREGRWDDSRGATEGAQQAAAADHAARDRTRLRRGREG
jgi:hypothetical protein